ncbi:MAG: MotA/TolQ/ExbB proton channel family protein [Elusimicrobia bacterium]|nr:MotA/TolQ/ExbB proton channel family protein [Elusimicrobiota bacterium]
MDLTTVLGAFGLTALLVVGVKTGQLPPLFLNWHGIAIVFGGTAAAMLLNTPTEYITRAVASLGLLLRGNPYPNTDKIVTAVVALAEKVRTRGAAAFNETDPRAVGGYLQRAAVAAAEHNNVEVVQQMLVDEINAAYDLNNETINVFRTASVLAPMFGLLGTLIGIVSVLKQISNPESVGAAMAVAMTTAFYGISVANVICVPIAGKLRIRNDQELKARSMVVEGVVMMMRGTVPIVIERKLKAIR